MLPIGICHSPDCQGKKSRETEPSETQYKPSTNLLVVIFVLLTALAQAVTLIRNGDQINLAMISVWTDDLDWACKKKTMYI